MSTKYIGNFPPPYGGVTIKNRLLYETLSEQIAIRHFEKPAWMPSNIYQLLSFLIIFLPGQQFIIGVSSKGRKSRLLTKMLFRFNKSSMRKSLYFMMGGQECYRIAESQEEIKWYSQYRQIYVETQTMKECLMNVEMNNISVYPNCRRRPMRKRNTRKNIDNRLRCVFFSLIQKEKGVDIILDVAQKLPEVDFAFYGHIADNYVNEFDALVERLDNATYKGVFKGSDEEVYKELNNYDVLLFPSRWKSEGVPGILAEAKIAGLAEIVSNQSYNAELVKNDMEGIVLKENNQKYLLEAIKRLSDNRKLLEYMKKNSFFSAERYFVDNYDRDILMQLKGKE